MEEGGILSDLGLHGVQLRDNRLIGKACVTWQPLVAALDHGRNQLPQSFNQIEIRHDIEENQLQL